MQLQNKRLPNLPHLLLYTLYVALAFVGTTLLKTFFFSKLPVARSGHVNNIKKLHPCCLPQNCILCETNVIVCREFLYNCMRYAGPLEIVLKRWTISVYVTLIKWPFLSAYCIDRVQTRLDNADLKSS